MKESDFFPSKYLKAADFDGDQVLTIEKVTREDFEGDFKPIVYFKETEKELVLNKTNFKTIANLHGQDSDSWAGQKIQLFTTEVDFKGEQVLAIRVRMKAPGANAVPEQNVGTITADQRQELFKSAMATYKDDRAAAELGVRKLLDFIGVTTTAALNQGDFNRICRLLETGIVPEEWRGKLDWTSPADLDDIPF